MTERGNLNCVRYRWQLLVVTLMGALISVASVAQSGSSEAIDTIVDHYLAAAIASDLDTMAAMWTEDVVYADPTAGARVEGKENVRLALEAGMSGAKDISLDVRSRFVGNNCVVLIYDGSAVMLVGDEKREVDVRTEAVMVLEIDDGLVAAHYDYIDYASLQTQIAAALAH